jgi:transcriptional regulator with XRE-family HTH domain
MSIPLVYVRIMTRDELRKWRTVNGYSQARLAKLLGVASMTVTRWEMGIRSIPPFLHLALIALEGGDDKPGTGRTQKGKTTGREV